MFAERPSSNLPSSHASELMMGPGPEESALGQACADDTEKSKKLPPCVDDDDDEEGKLALLRISKGWCKTCCIHCVKQAH